jgi:hypothetical protein
MRWTGLATSAFLLATNGGCESNSAGGAGQADAIDAPAADGPAGVSDGPSDGAPVADAPANADGSAGVDAAVDAPVVVDASTGADGPASADASTGADGAVVDAATGADGPAAADASTGADGPAAADGAAGLDGSTTDDAGSDGPLPLFSFFVTSLQTMQEQSGSPDGFGGDLGGLAGADQICQTAAANVGFGQKTWRAFLSVTEGGAGSPIHAIDRVGAGPWYDRNGRLIAMDVTGLLNTRPAGDPQTVNDLPDEFGVPLSTLGDSHDILTGSNTQGQLDDPDPVSTCQDWTSSVGPGSEMSVRCGHSWPAMSGQHWIRAHQVGGCAPGVNLMQTGPPMEPTVGSGGGYGGIYCFALEP